MESAPRSGARALKVTPIFVATLLATALSVAVVSTEISSGAVETQELIETIHDHPAIAS